MYINLQLKKIVGDNFDKKNSNKIETKILV